ncbi:MAG: hypothetical protein JJU13_10745 [Balneolaceae bacterium]|nr:hypothetical protein [Balneolaceae bacterium]
MKKVINRILEFITFPFRFLLRLLFGWLRPVRPEVPVDETFVVSGRVVSHELRGLPGLRVVALDKNVGGDVQLGEGATGERGDYEIRYTTRPLRQGKQKPDVQVQAIDENNNTLAVSHVRYNANLQKSLNFLLPMLNRKNQPVSFNT